MTTSGSYRFRFLLTVAAAALLLTAPAADAKGHLAQAVRRGGTGGRRPRLPHYGNGGYDVSHYDLDIAYNPATDA